MISITKEKKEKTITLLLYHIITYRETVLSLKGEPHPKFSILGLSFGFKF